MGLLEPLTLSQIAPVCHLCLGLRIGQHLQGCCQHPAPVKRLLKKVECYSLVALVRQLFFWCYDEATPISIPAEGTLGGPPTPPGVWGVCGEVVVVVEVVVEHRGCEEVEVVVVVEESVGVARVELEVLAEVEGGGGPICGTICSLTDFSIAPRGSILLTDSLSCERGPPPLVKSGELRSN
ncbi:hypothetical protein E2C01_039069 [Portunus trituberculatus]|uniref:Uncharacterized protein n=1 Tax=Portunus trituberculatus TaxID=210409 RepID=A0A5B7FDT8_PORTR|nr:hypothetical protein [Portunus trituberculatus]